VRFYDKEPVKRQSKGIGVEGQKVYSEQGIARPLTGQEGSEMRTGIVGQTVHSSDQGRQALN
jgi:hypothetical protein